jgi:putative ABC transport system substrate-binding protein
MPVRGRNRRAFIAGLGGAAAWPLVARGQQKVFRVGILNADGDLTAFPPWRTFVAAFRDLGWIERKDFIYENRFADNRLDRLADLVAELVALPVDIIVTIGTLAPLAAKRATSTIPIVMIAAGDPLGSGLVPNLARPGGNVTGLSLMSSDVWGKRLELVKELLPKLSHVAVLWNSGNPHPANSFKETQSAGQILKLNIQSFEVKKPDELDDALRAMEAQHPDALITIEDPLTVDHRQQITDFANTNQLPAIYGLREFVDVGGLMAYAPSGPDIFRRAAGYVDTILKGAKAGDLPVEQPTKFELIINLKTAKTLGLTIPPTLLARADEVIE